MLHRMSDESKIDFLSKLQSGNDKKSVDEKNQKDSESKKCPDTIESQKAKKLKNEEVTHHKGILSAGRGSITDFGGPKKHMGSQSNNSIWDNDVVHRLSGVKDNGERIKEEKKNIERVRKGLREETLDYYANQLKESDTRKSSNVSGLSEFSGSKYNTPQNNLSIFDNDAFDDMPEKTEGEKIAENARKPKPKDDSWQKNTGTKKLNNSSLMSNLFDNLESSDNE